MVATVPLEFLMEMGSGIILATGNAAGFLQNPDRPSGDWRRFVRHISVILSCFILLTSVFRS